jgi:hypothetical protein
MRPRRYIDDLRKILTEVLEMSTRSPRIRSQLIY